MPPLRPLIASFEPVPVLDVAFAGAAGLSVAEAKQPAAVAVAAGLGFH